MLAAGALSLFGFTMPTPMLPVLREQFALTATQVGMVSSSFAAGMFFAVMFLPSMSDRLGRRLVAAVALVCVAIGFLAQGLVLDWGLGFDAFLAMRLLTGLFAGCNPIFKAYLADVVPASRLPQFMVYREASATTAFVVGPTLGGYLATSRVGAAGPLYATAVVHLLAASAVLALVRESVGLPGTGRSQGGADVRKQAEERASGVSRQHEGRTQWTMIFVVFVMSFFYVFGQSCFSSFFPLLMSDRFGSTPLDIGKRTTFFSLLVLCVQVFAYRPLHRRLGLHLAGAAGGLCLAAGLVGLGSSAVPCWLACAMYAVGVAVFPATIPTLLTGAAPSTRRGFVLGMDSIVNNLCRVASPMMLAVLYAQSAGLAFGAAGFLMLLAVLALLALGRARARGRGAPG